MKEILEKYKNFEKKLKYLGKNYIFIDFFKNIIKNSIIFSENENIIISSKKNNLRNIKLFLEKRFDINSKIDLKKSKIKIENFLYEEGNIKIKNIIKKLYFECLNDIKVNFQKIKNNIMKENISKQEIKKKKIFLEKEFNLIKCKIYKLKENKISSLN
ncbi:hypothetical protein [Candidatus Vidania fulgoroideorum]